MFPFAMTMIFGVKMNIFSKEKSDKEVSDYLNAMSLSQLILTYSSIIGKSNKSKKNIIDVLLKERSNIFLFQRIANNV